MNPVVAALLVAISSAGCQKSASPLTTVSEVPLPGGATRFDYQSFDSTTGRLYVSHMGDGSIVVFDTRSNKTIAELSDFPRVTGMLAVPEEGRVYASVPGRHGVAALLGGRTFKPVGFVAGGRFPDGIAYVPKLRRLFVSDESGGVDLVIDAKTNKLLGKIDLGGEAGNTHYDPKSNLVWVAQQTTNELIAIDPAALGITHRIKLPSLKGAHGFLIDPLMSRAYVTGEDNNRLVVVDLYEMVERPDLGSFEVTDGPDVLAFDPGLSRLYLACEGGAIEVFRVTSNGLKRLGTVRRQHAHSVAVDPKSHRVYVPLQDVGGKPEMWVLEPG